MKRHKINLKNMLMINYFVKERLHLNHDSCFIGQVIRLKMKMNEHIQINTLIAGMKIYKLCVSPSKRIVSFRETFLCGTKLLKYVSM